MKKPYVGCMVMKVGGTLGTVLDYKGGPSGHYCTVAWYRENGIVIDRAVHYTHIHGWMNNLAYELNKNKSQ